MNAVMGDYISYKNIINQFDINAGDTLLVGSDIRKLSLVAMRHKEQFDANMLIDSMIEKVGASGTLLLPTFNWDFCSGVAFDYKKTPSKTGSLSTIALARDDFMRTRHPIYSFAVHGKNQNMLVEMKNRSSFGADSPFAYLHEQKAKMLLIDLSIQNSFTFAHYVEEMCKADYRYMKDFTADYIDIDGNKSQETYSMFVRDIERKVVTALDPISDIMEEAGVLVRKNINGIDFLLIDLSSAYDIIGQDIIKNEGRNLYEIVEEN